MTIGAQSSDTIVNKRRTEYKRNERGNDLIMKGELTHSEVGIYSGEERGANAVMFILAIRYVMSCSWIAEFLRETKVYDVDEISVFAGTHYEVGRFDISVDQVPRVNIFDSRDLRREAGELWAGEDEKDRQLEGIFEWKRGNW